MHHHVACLGSSTISVNCVLSLLVVKLSLTVYYMYTVQLAGTNDVITEGLSTTHLF